MATFATHGKMKASFNGVTSLSQMQQLGFSSEPVGRNAARTPSTAPGLVNAGSELFSTITQTKPGRGSNGNGLRERDGLYHDGIALSQSKGPFAGRTVKTGYVPTEGYRQVPRPIINAGSGLTL